MEDSGRYRAYRSFIDFEPQHIGEMRQVETASAEVSLSYLDSYKKNKHVFQKEGKVDIDTARELASVEASAFFLSMGNRVPPRTYDVYRSLRTLVYSGQVSEKKLKGNVLVVGSGETISELLALTYTVDISDIESYAQMAKDQIENIKNDDYDSIAVVNDNLLENHISFLSRRTIKNKRIDCVEPDEVFVQNAKKVISDSPDVFQNSYIHDETIGLFLDKKDARTTYDFIMSVRTEPRMWSEGLSDDDMYGQINGQVAAGQLRKTSSEIHDLYVQLESLLKSGGAMYVSVGTGRDISEYKSRHTLVDFLEMEGEDSERVLSVSRITHIHNAPQWKTMNPDVEALVIKKKERKYSNKKKRRKRR